MIQQLDTNTTTLLSLAGIAATTLAYGLYRAASKRHKTKKHNIHTSSSLHCNHDLKQHTHIFKQQVLQIQNTNNVYVAIGYSLANCIMIEGDIGIIIIDTTESLSSAQAVLNEFRKITNKPVAGIIYTHFHHDHVGGSEVFIKESLNGSTCPIYAHETTDERISNFTSITGPLAYVRATKMYGTKLDKPSFENCGIGPFLAGVDDKQGLENSPTHTYNTPTHTINIAGIELQLIHCPGETDDQTVVYMPQHNILFAADNYYESFPNLYTIRGAPNRDVVQWANSIDIMINTKPDVMVPSHTLPVYGAQEIQTRLQNYRDAIQYVHDQTVRLMLKNYHPDEIASMIQLPSNFRDCEYLKEFYGTVGWSSKAIFDGYMGWYSGDECDLMKLTPAEYAHRLIDLAGSVETVLDKAQCAFDDGDFQWALELSSAILRVQEKSTRHVIKAAKELKTQCCVQLGQKQISANARNWYLTSALINEGEIPEIKVPKKHLKNFILTKPLGMIFSTMCVRFNPSKSLAGVTKSLSFILKDGEDSTEGWTLTIRNCVLYSKNEASLDSDIVIETTENALRYLFAQPSSIAKSVMSNDFSVKKGDVRTFLQFVRNFDLDL